jgi:hypothetical protein
MPELLTGKPEIVEIGAVFRSHFKPFKARARWPSGEERWLVVKPQRATPRNTVEHLFAEWCGYAVGAALGLPIPPHYLVEVTAEALRPLGPAFSDIIPGIAFATEFQSPHFKCSELGFPREAQIRNLQSVSGMIVLDTLIWNNDREDDVIAVPVRGSSRFDLVLIDNTWIVFAREDDPSQIQGRYPRDWTLRRLAKGLEGLPPYVLAAGSLDIDSLRDTFASAPQEFLASAPDTCANIAEAITWRGEHVAQALERDRPPDI